MMDYQADQECKDAIKNGKDDEILIGDQDEAMFKVLFVIFLLCAVYAAAATVLLVHDMINYPKIQLIIFYIFANLTLFGKSDSITNAFISEASLLF